MARNRLTLLDVVQEVLSKMNHDNVNTIDQTVESRQIAREAKTVYYDLMDRDDWPHLVQLKQLGSLSDPTRPNMLVIPQNVTVVQNVRYEKTKDADTARTFNTLKYLEGREFLDLCFHRRSDADNVITVPTRNNVDLFILNDQAPTYWTTFDDEYIILDSYDSLIDTTIQGSKSLAMVKEIPEWRSLDTFIPDMPDQMFSVFVAEVTAAASMYWKQGASVKDEQRAARGISRLRKDARKTYASDQKADYGRRRSSHYVRTEDGDKGSIRDSLSF